MTRRTGLAGLWRAAAAVARARKIFHHRGAELTEEFILFSCFLRCSVVKTNRVGPGAAEHLSTPKHP